MNLVATMDSDHNNDTITDTPSSHHESSNSSSKKIVRGRAKDPRSRRAFAYRMRPMKHDRRRRHHDLHALLVAQKFKPTHVLLRNSPSPVALHKSKQVKPDPIIDAAHSSTPASTTVVDDDRHDEEHNGAPEEQVDDDATREETWSVPRVILAPMLLSAISSQDSAEQMQQPPPAAAVLDEEDLVSTVTEVVDFHHENELIDADVADLWAATTMFPSHSLPGWDGRSCCSSSTPESLSAVTGLLLDNFLAGTPHETAIVTRIVSCDGVEECFSLHQPDFYELWDALSMDMELSSLAGDDDCYTTGSEDDDEDDDNDAAYYDDTSLADSIELQRQRYHKQKLDELETSPLDDTPLNKTIMTRAAEQWSRRRLYL